MLVGLRIFGDVGAFGADLSACDVAVAEDVRLFK